MSGAADALARRVAARVLFRSAVELQERSDGEVLAAKARALAEPSDLEHLRRLDYAIRAAQEAAAANVLAAVAELELVEDDEAGT